MAALPQRLAELWTAYEEFLIVKGVRDAIDACEWAAQRQRRDFWVPVYVIPDFPEIRTRLYYIEASLERQPAAVAAAADYAAAYRTAFTSAHGRRPELRTRMTASGLLSPNAVDAVVRRRLGREPMWRRRRLAVEALRAKTIRFHKPDPQEFDQRPIPCVNEPVDAIRFWTDKQDDPTLAAHQ